MDTMLTASSVLSSAIIEWLADEALQQSEPAKLLGELCLRLRAVGIPVMRSQLAFRVLHPLYDASTLTWSMKRDVLVEHFRPEQTGQEQFLRSPVGYALTNRLPVFRRRLTGPTALLDFEVLEDFRGLGGTDYLIFLISFDPSGQNGVICSWLGDRASGFTDDEIAQLQRVTRELGIAMKSRLEHSVAENIAHAYLGRHAGQAVLNGSIRRGDGEKITAALWYSDLRRSTELADRLSTEDFLELLGRYFEMTASAVLDHGGEVVSLIGDAVLGLFRVEGSPQEACARALAAAHEARRRLEVSLSNNAGGPELDFGISLHLGQVIYGNVGVPERLQFTVVGAAVNEVVRVQDLTKQLGCPLLATETFADAVAESWQPLGEHRLRGREILMPILTVPVG
ncbi:adenylate/guanylate cyclase domain-containing protein [Bradyrhizobium sp. dw_411]|uniref:adenylate/guanylate cyclase domain-containing protein n=1 Tax=Bradyrhizobium sp. dw_411 TaxID=2720082 RepID=UPI001BCD5F84|nr:adenylate/guanylate cyclase domain-containing protein [Bradyrhizobium sp. dw_411]